MKYYIGVDGGGTKTAYALFDENKNSFAPIVTEEVLLEIEKARDKASITLVNDGLIEEANTHATELLTQIFTAMGFNFVDIKIYDPLDSSTQINTEPIQ